MSQQAQLDPKTVDKTLDRVTVLLDALTVDQDPPQWDPQEAHAAHQCYEVALRMNLEQQVALVRNIALKIRSAIVLREIADEIDALRQEVAQ